MSLHSRETDAANAAYGQALAELAGLPEDDPRRGVQQEAVHGQHQGLDLVAKVLLDPGSRVLVETPTYLGALQAFSPMEPVPVAVASDAGGVVVEDMVAQARATATRIWEQINEPNLRENVRPTRNRASLILTKGADHQVTRIRLRKL